MPQEFLSDGKGNVSGVRTVEVEWTKDDKGQWKMTEKPNSEKVSVPFLFWGIEVRFRVKSMAYMGL